MGFPLSPSPPPHDLYSQALQLKLYQAFIFSIPILFSIILFLLFYLFYLKKRASSFSSHPPPILPTSTNQATQIFMASVVCEVGLKGDLKDKLHKIVFDEDIRARDSGCCVCLGEFEMKEELLQVPSCKHVFHVECIRHWLGSNTTCPLCRCSVVVSDTTTKLLVLPRPPLNININIHESNLLQQQQQDPQQRQLIREQVSNTTVGTNEPTGGSSSSNSNSNSNSNACTIVSHEMEHLENQASVTLHIQD